jgi:rubrerythrin
MTHSEVCAVLNELIQMDYDAIVAYRQAIDHIDVSAVRDQLMVYQNDHVRHTLNLSDIVRRLSEQPCERDGNTTELVTEGFAAVGSSAGTDEALNAMCANEKLVSKKYRQYAALPMPTDIRAQVELNYHDEQRHLSYIELKLSQKTASSSM